MPGVPERFQGDGRRRSPSAYIRKEVSPQDEWMTPEVMDNFEQHLFKDYYLDGGDRHDDDDDDRWAYLMTKRQGDYIPPEEYEFLKYQKPEAPPPPLNARAAGSLQARPRPQFFDRPKCDNRKNKHIIPRHLFTPSALPMLEDFLTEQGTLIRRKTSGLCGVCQRRITKMVKRARHLGIIPWNLDFYSVNLLGFPDDEHKSRISKTI